MIDSYLYNDIRREVEKKCKRLYKKGFWDRSWLKEVDKVMQKSFSEINNFINK